MLTHILSGGLTRLSRNRVLGSSLALLAALALAGLTGVAPAQADTTPVIYGSSWLGGNGVNACGASTDPTCGGQPHVGGLASDWWQCVELAQRLYYRRGWYTADGGLFPVTYAYQIYDKAGAMGMTAQPNGSITSIVPGDMIVHTSADGGGAGHVAVVDKIVGSTVYAVEQNINNSADEAAYTLSAGTLSRGGMHIRGVVHSPNNPNSTGQSSGLQMFNRGDGAVFASGSLGYNGWVQETDPGNAAAIAAGAPYQMFLRGDSAVFAKNSIGNGGWVQETSPGTANEIAISSTGVQMIRTSDAAIYDKNTIGNGGWTQVAAPGNAQAIAVGGNTEMFIRGDAAVFAKTYGSSGWTQETSPGNATAIAVSSTGLQMFIRGDGAVFATNSIGGPWTQETAPGNATAIAAGGNTQMFIRGDSAVFAKNSIGYGGWTQETDPGNAIAIAVGSSGTQMFIRGDSAVFAENTIGSTHWVQETDPGNATAIASG